MKKILLPLLAWGAGTLSLLAQPVITNQPASQIIVTAGNVTFSVMAMGTGPFSYQWQLNGTNLPNNIITTVAGGGNSGDGGAATNASLNWPYGIGFDKVGNLYIADFFNNLVRRVDANGIITTVAGGGTGGDGGAATNASLSQPIDVACDASGNLFISENSGNLVRKVNTNGIITTVAGGGNGGDGGAATNASLNAPTAVTFDASGNLYIVDSGSGSIREVHPNGIITTVAGGGVGGGLDGIGDGGAATNAILNWPFRAVFDAFGNLFISDTFYNCIRKVDTHGIITKIAGSGINGVAGGGYSGDGGASTNSLLFIPRGVGFDASENLFVADTDNNSIRKIDTNGIITTVIHAGMLNSPSDVIFDSIGNLYIADTKNNLVREMHYAGINSFTITNLSTNNSGNYTVIVGSVSGSVTSSVANLTVVLPPTIVVKPAGQGAAIGSNFTFRVDVAGTSPFNYQWSYGGAALNGETNSTLTLFNVTSNMAGSYRVFVSNSYGSVTSQAVMLHVGYAPFIISPLTNQIILNGSRVIFNGAAFGTGPITYQWQFNGTNLPNNIISTVAGNGVGTYAGDGSPATNASIFNSTGVAANGQGNFLIADRYSSRIRRVGTNGIITTVAGTNSVGFAGDGGLASLAELNEPFGVALDPGGNYFIADTGNNCIRKVDTNGLISTVAGTGTAGYGGDGAAATNANLNTPRGVAVDGAGNLFIADYNNTRIRKVDTNGFISTIVGTNGGGFAGDGGPAFNARIGPPQGVAVDAAGNLFIADYGNNRIRRVDAGGVITTVAGNGTGLQAINDGGPATNACLTNPTGVAVDTDGYVFIADWNDNRIRQVDPNGIITTVAGNGSTTYSGDGGAATNARLHQPFGVACEAAGSLLIADMDHSRIRRATLGRIPSLQFNSVTTNNAGNYQVIVTSPYGSVTSSVVTLTVVFVPSVVVQPQSVTVTNGNAADFGLVAAGTGPLGYQWYWNTGSIGGGTNATLAFPAAAAGQAGNYFCVITNAYGSITSNIATLMVLTAPGIGIQPTNQVLLAGNNITLNVGATGTGPFTYQWRLNGTNLPNKNNIITRVAGASNQTGFSGDGGPATNAALFNPSGVILDVSGNVFIVDQWDNRIRRVDTNGIIKTVAGIGPNGSNGSYSGDGGMATNAGMNLTAFSLPAGMALDATGNMYIADVGNNRIRLVTANGMISTFAANLNSPAGVAVDGSGHVFIADAGNNRIRKVGTNGIIVTVAGTNSAGFAGDGGLAVNAKLSSPCGLATDSAGNLFIADRGNNRIRKIDMNGLITTVAGNGGTGYSGDNLTATNTSLYQPYGVAVDAYGDIMVADYANSRIRMVGNNGVITTLAGTGNGGYSGDGGTATNANVYEPTGVGLDTFGNIFFSSSLYSTVRKVDLGRVPTLQLNSVAAANAGNYDVVVTSPYGSVTSSVVSLTVLLPPSITTQPTNTRAVFGSSAGFNVAVSGPAPFNYQWFTSSGRTATAMPILLGGHVLFAIVTATGSGYASVPQVHFIGGSGSGATGTAVINNGTVTSISITSQGSGYSPTPPTIQIDPPSAINATTLPNQTNTSFLLPSVATIDATNYFVVVTNNYGSVTSAMVTLTVFLPPQNFTVQNLGTGLQLQLAGTPNYPYILQTATNLTPPIGWQSIRTNNSDVSGSWQFTDTNMNGDRKFYRAMGQ